LRERHDRSSKDCGLDTTYSPSMSIVLFPRLCFLQEESSLVGRIVAKPRDPQFKTSEMHQAQQELRPLA
ncbi:hypothetical protein KXV77_000873, partial [Aspergillus fumigatus]